MNDFALRESIKNKLIRNYRVCQYKEDHMLYAEVRWVPCHHSMLIHAPDVNLLGDNTDTIKKITETLNCTIKEVGPEVNVKKTKYMLLSRHQNAGQNHDIKITN
jgi:hypothetical protein